MDFKFDTIPLFTIDEEEQNQLVEFWNRWGFVVVKDVLTREQIDKSIDEIWRVIEDQSEARRSDTSSWYENHWPDKTQKGFIQPLNDFYLQQAWINRQNPKIIKAFQLVLGQEEISSSRDRYGFMRPTIVKETRTEGEISTSKNWLHWDQNGWGNSGFQGVQGVLTFTDHTENSGGFHCVPGFKHEFSNWFAKNSQDEHPNGFDGLVEVPIGDKMRENVRKILCPAGSIIIWDSRTPHGNYPNKSDSAFRAVQYITYSKYDKENGESRSENLWKEARNSYRTYGDDWDLQLPPKELQLPNFLTEQGRKVIGFECW